MTDPELRIVRIQGLAIEVPDDKLPDPDPFHGGGYCSAREPAWPDGNGGTVFCTLKPHGGGAHVANNGGAEVIAVWWDAGS